MRIQWYGQSAFAITGDDASVFIDPFGDMSPMAGRGVQFEYPPIEGATADLVLVTHEHLDHNAVETVGGDPAILRAAAGTHESPLGEVVAISSEHDPVAGTQRGHNVIFVFTLDGVRVAHFGDFGQSALRDEQAALLEGADLVFLPVGGGPTIDATGARAIVDRLSPRWVVPMHYRTPRISFLETADTFLGTFDQVHRAQDSTVDTGDLPSGNGPVAVVPATP